jgi:hypothetical protein
VTEAEIEAEREAEREEEPSSLQKHTLVDVPEVVVEREGVSEGATEMKEGAEADDVLQSKTKANVDSKGEGEAMMEGVSETKDSEAGSAGLRAASPFCYDTAITLLSLLLSHCFPCCYDTAMTLLSLLLLGIQATAKCQISVNTYLNGKHATLIKCV